LKLQSLNQNNPSNLDDITLLIPNYSKKSLYNKFNEEGAFKKLKAEEKAASYTKLFETVIGASNTSIKVRLSSESFESLTDAERKTHLYLTYVEKFGIREVAIFTVDDNGNEKLLLPIIVDGMNLGLESNLKSILQTIDDYLDYERSESEQEQIDIAVGIVSEGQDYLKEKSKERGTVGFGIGNFEFNLNSGGAADNNYADRMNLKMGEDEQFKLNQIYLDNSRKFEASIKEMELVIPMEHKSDKLTAVLNKWDLSKYRFEDMEALSDESKLDENLFTITTQQISSIAFKSTFIRMTSLTGNKLFSATRSEKSNMKYFEVLDFILEMKKEDERKFEIHNTMRFIKSDNETTEIPELNGSNLVFADVQSDDDKNYKKLNSETSKMLDEMQLKGVPSDKVSQYRLYIRRSVRFESQKTIEQENIGELNTLSEDNKNTDWSVIEVEQYTFLIYNSANEQWHCITGEGRSLKDAIALFKEKLKK
ncbi:MAG: hypothetical protein HRT57_08415, partial [Crocinitomicaceae bacterium]|nr:hypothetical protein [Crocinitomicaceae bacterium]